MNKKSREISVVILKNPLQDDMWFLSSLKKLVKSQSVMLHSAWPLCDLTSFLICKAQHDHSVIWQVFWFVKLFNHCGPTTIAIWEWKDFICRLCYGWFELKLFRNLIRVQRIFFNIGPSNSSLYVAVRMIHNSILHFLQRISNNPMPKYGPTKKKFTSGMNYFWMRIFIYFQFNEICISEFVSLLTKP